MLLEKLNYILRRAAHYKRGNEESRSMKFKSKVDWWVWATFGLYTLATIWLTCLLINGKCDTEIWISAIILWIFELFMMIPIYFGTYYSLDADSLFVRSWIIKERIPYDKIVGIKETRNPLASGALSLDRIEIKYSKGKSWPTTTMISPKDKQEFLRLLEEKRTSTESRCQ